MEIPPERETMEQPIKVFELDDNTRITAYYDNYPYDLPELVGDNFGIQTLNISKDYREINFSDEVMDIVERVKNSVNYFTHNNYQEKRERILTFWLSRRGYCFEFITLRGYSQSDWADVLVYTKLDQEYLNHRISELKDWFRGDVYLVAVERKKVFTASDGETLERWDIEDSVSGVLVDNESEFEQIGKDLISA